jgi:hypothetical protein
MTFRTCSAPASTLVKPQPAPAILSQELVHTTLSITHHTRKHPSTGPRTTHGPKLTWRLWPKEKVVVPEEQRYAARQTVEYLFGVPCIIPMLLWVICRS